MQKIIESSGNPISDRMLDLLPIVRVHPTNDDGSILAFSNKGMTNKALKQRIFGSTGYVQDKDGTVGEVLLLVDEAMNLSELEIVSTGLETIGSPMWETFKLADQAAQ